MKRENLVKEVVLLKRIVTFSKRLEDGKFIVNSISAPVDDDSISDLISGNPNVGFIDANYTDPIEIEGKKIEMTYNPSQHIIEICYVDITFDELDPHAKIAYLKKENAELRQENERLKEENLLTQDALFEVDAKVEALLVGGGKE